VSGRGRIRRVRRAPLRRHRAVAWRIREHRRIAADRFSPARPRARDAAGADDAVVAARSTARPGARTVAALTSAPSRSAGARTSATAARRYRCLVAAGWRGRVGLAVGACDRDVLIALGDDWR
jgi:hypothetical protein